MRSAILVKSKKPLVVTDISLPEKLEYGQVLVKFVIVEFVEHKLMKLMQSKDQINFYLIC